ncbi:MAG: tetratricopeptide repeat protein [Lysobacterales bacterium]
METISSILEWLESREGLLSALTAVAAMIGISYGVVNYVVNSVSRARKKRNKEETRAANTSSRKHKKKKTSVGLPSAVNMSSIAVLPLKTLSNNEDDINIAAGLSSEISADLAQVPDLRVSSRIASSCFRGEDIDLKEVAEVLSIRYVLTGSFQRQGDRMRLMAELTDAFSGEQLWASTYDRELVDLFAVQAEVSKAIVGAIGGELKLANTRIAYEAPTKSLDAWGLVQKAYNFWLTSFTPQDYDLSLSLLRKAVKIDPLYAGARASLAMILSQRAVNGLSQDEYKKDRDEALEMIEEAVRLEPNDITVLENAGLVWTHHGHGLRARQALRHAVELSPLDLIAWGYLGLNLGWIGQGEDLQEAVDILNRLLNVAPKHPSTPYWYYFLSSALLRQGKVEEAEAAAHAVLKIQPSYYIAWISLANIYGQLGDYEKAREAAERSLAINPLLTLQKAAESMRIVSMTDEAVEPLISGLRSAGLIDSN